MVQASGSDSSRCSDLLGPGSWNNHRLDLGCETAVAQVGIQIRSGWNYCGALSVSYLGVIMSLKKYPHATLQLLSEAIRDSDQEAQDRLVANGYPELSHWWDAVEGIEKS